MTERVFKGFGGVRLRADCFGSEDNPPVLLLPAAGQTKEMWHGAGQALAAAGRWAICMDLRGHGGSDQAGDGRYDLDAYAADIEAVLAQLPARAAVVGAGASGLAALIAIGEGTANSSTALVLVGVTLWIDPKKTPRIGAAMAQRTAAFDDEAAALAAVSAIHPFEPEPLATDKLLFAFERGEDGRFRWRCDHRTVGSIDLSGNAARLEAAAGALAVPVSLVRGTANESVSAEATARLGAVIAGSEVAEIEGAGHYVATDREDAFNAVLLDFLERKAPRAPISYRGGADPKVLREALGCFGTGVTIVTTIDDKGEPIGLTANSFTSVSLDPPLILFCLAGNSSSMDAFRGAGRFAINVLHIGQQPASGRFARRDGARFEGTPWELRSEGGSPILAGSLASFDCRTHAIHESGDHVIFVGEVQQAYFEPHRDPLLYFRGKYRRLHFA